MTIEIDRRTVLMRRCRPWQDEATLRYLYHERGYSQYEMADMLETGAATISEWFRKHEIESRSISEQAETYGPMR